MVRKIVSVVMVVCCLAGGIAWFVYLKQMNTPVSEGINAIPVNAVMVMESRQARKLWRKLSQTNLMWEELLGTELVGRMNGVGRSIDSLLELNKDVGSALDNHSVFVSAHVSSSSELDLLYIYSMPNLTYETYFEDFLKSIDKNAQKQDYAGVAIGRLKLSPRKGLYYAFQDGILMMSEQEDLVKESIRQLKSGNSLVKDASFGKVVGSAGKNADASVYVNYKTFPKLLRLFSSSKLGTRLEDVSHFADCSGWDVQVKANALSLTGFTQVSDSTRSYLRVFSNQKPQEIEMTKVIPNSTAQFLFFGVSNFSTFYRDSKLEEQTDAHHAANEVLLSSINTRYEVNVANCFLNWMNNEMAMVVTEPSGENLMEKSYGVFRSNNIKNAVGSLTDLAKQINKTEGTKLDTARYRDHTITLLPLPTIIPLLFGNQFAELKNNYFTSLGNYVVVGNSAEALHPFIDAYENHKTLSEEKSYKDFSSNLSSETNLYFYSSIPRSSLIYGSMLNKKCGDDLTKHLKLTKKFEGVAIQFSSNKKSFYSTIFLKYNSEQKQESSTLWESVLDTTISSKPWMVLNHLSNTKEIVVQDDAYKLYLISATGKILWRKQLDGKIMSDLLQVDALKNNKLQLLFNTMNRIYVIDRNGNDLKGFPINLKSPATNALALIDYENNKEYRIFIATENKHILCYKINGELVNGFKFDKTKATVFLPITYFRANNKDHLGVVDVKGNVYIMDRHGESKLTTKEQMPTGMANFFVESGKDYAHTFVIGCDTLGNVIKLSLSGDGENIKFQSFETSPYFYYYDINRDDKKEYIFLTRNELKVFSQDKSLLYKYEFKDTVSGGVQLFTSGDGNVQLGVVSESANELFLINENGLLNSDFPLSGKTSFSIGDMNGEGLNNVVTGGGDKRIYVYQLH